MRAAVRELKEETGLQPYYSKFLFRHEGKINPRGFRDYHTVCLFKANGRA